MKKFKAWLRKNLKKLILAAVVLVIGFLVWQNLTDDTPQPRDTSYSEVSTNISINQAVRATLYNEDKIVQLTLKNGDVIQSHYVDGGGVPLQIQLQTANVPFDVQSSQSGGFTKFLRDWGVLLLLAFFILAPMGANKLLKKQSMSGVLGKTGAHETEPPTERFTDVHGAKEAIEQLSMLRDRLNNPAKYEVLDPCRGVIFYGPSGTGKTLLARAVAGEAGVPFFQVAGSDFESMWGGGMSEKLSKFYDGIRSKIKNKKAAFIVFFDEFDSLASTRTGEANADRSRDSAVDTLLDLSHKFFREYPNCLQIGATNHLDRIDAAVKSPHRFGRHIAMPNPDRTARLAILKSNVSGLNIRPEDLETIAYLTAGMNGASMARIPHEAAAIAYRAGKEDEPISRHYLERAAMELAMGTLRDSADVHPEDQNVANVHESGHATLAYASPYHTLLITTSIPIEQSGGSTWFSLTDRTLLTTDIIKWHMAVSMAGREAERHINGTKAITSGAAHDIETATGFALRAICETGLFASFTTKVDVDNWEDHPRAAEIDDMVRKLVKEAGEFALDQLLIHESFREHIQMGLEEDRMLHSDEIEAIYAAIKAAKQQVPKDTTAAVM